MPFPTLRARCRHFLRGLFHRDQVEHELREELDGYLDMLVEQKRARGCRRTRPGAPPVSSSAGSSR